MTNLRAILLGICAAGFILTPPLASADELITPPLRDGAIVCEPDPETGLRAVFLPAAFHEVTETIILQDAPTELVYMPLRVSDNGEVISRAQFVERIVPHKPIGAVRWAVFLPVQIGYIHKDGMLWDSSYTKLNEQANIDKIKAQGGATTTHLPNPRSWAYWQGEYKKKTQDKRQRMLDYYDKRMRAAKAFIHPVVISSDTPENLGFADINISSDEVFSALRLPIQYSLRSERQLLESWPVYAARVKLKPQGYYCDGHNLSEVYLDDIPGVKQVEEQGIQGEILVSPIVAPEYVTIQKLVTEEKIAYLFYNRFGKRLSAGELEAAGYDEYMVKYARAAEQRFAVRAGN